MLATIENNGIFLSDPCTDFQPQSMIPGKQGACGYSVLPLMKNLATMWLAKQRTQFSYRCDQCGKGYQHRATLVRHTRHECGKDPKFKCPYCVHRTKQRGNLYQHIRTNHPGKNVFTKNCKIVRAVTDERVVIFRTVGELPLAAVLASGELLDAPGQHQDDAKLPTIDDPPGVPRQETRVLQLPEVRQGVPVDQEHEEPPEGASRCEYCGREFIWESSLRLHKKMACGKPPNFFCSLCTYKSNFKGNLKRHLFNVHKIVL
ncbi:hypothetical protein KQX54_003837 [Cotesia glomerata]|uniref:C2H2-type domain-containing protein n=1 Tax=Cotesia glomerata TaxID=32391 RepID=A0AAV7IKR7_COTGL|nr:hypothetical protein KQX54_003837 [Cotesia glomerata]